MSKQFQNVSEYPLSWPAGWAQSKARASSQFKTTLYKALRNVETEIVRFAKDTGKKIDNLVISSNVTLGNQNPDNPGVAVYFTFDNERTCIPVDRYNKVQDNLQAIFKVLEAKRTEYRHGGLNLIKASFRGYAALPDPGKRNWRDVLGYQGHDIDEVKQIYRRKIKESHPDNGGNASAAAAINDAWAEAKKHCVKSIRG